MTSNLALSAIDPHSYGLKAAQAVEPAIDRIFISTNQADLIKSIALINQISDAEMRDRAMQALSTYAGTGNRDAAMQSVKGYEYLAALLYLGQHMHALAVKDKMLQNKFKLEHLPILDEMPTYPRIKAIDQPAATSITEILCESIQASNAPSAAISAATASI